VGVKEGIGRSLEKFTEGLEEAPRHIFKFDTLNFDNKYFDKKS